MIRQIELSEIDKLQPLLEQFYLEQQTYVESFNWDYIKFNLTELINNPRYIILVDEDFTCFFIGHHSFNLLLTIEEAFEDYIYVQPKSRGTAKFLMMMIQFEEWCIDQGIKYINIGVGTGIMNEKVKALYTRFGYTEYYSGFKKEIV